MVYICRVGTVLYIHTVHKYLFSVEGLGVRLGTVSISVCNNHTVGSETDHTAYLQVWGEMSLSVG